ncbi:hypothetical protein J3R83DRAFT_11315 [Lanmaoa asiatica]|nr:hypothetical protein J3R83DRAFT_11315 [Lanmaoa asiatica]
MTKRKCTTKSTKSTATAVVTAGVSAMQKITIKVPAPLSRPPVGLERASTPISDPPQSPASLHIIGEDSDSLEQQPGDDTIPSSAEYGGRKSIRQPMIMIL